MEKIKKNLANIITLSRIFFVFIVIALLFCKDCAYSYYCALVLTAILMWFDGLDGFVARKFNISSKLGALLDIMGDRIVENVFWISFCAYSEEEIAWLYVLPEKMRHGIGRQLVAHALNTESALYYVEALFGNEPAKRLYESFGFTVKEVLSGQMPGNECFQVKVYSMYRDIQRKGTGEIRD